MTILRKSALALAWSSLFLLGACSLPSAWLSKSSCLAVLASTVDLPADLTLRTRMKLTAGDESIRLETFAQRVDDRLVVVGISNYGVRLFAVQQVERELTIESVESRNLEIIARWVMDALHRIYWIQPAARDTEAEQQEWAWGEERVIESSTRDGRRRRFVRGGGDGTSEGVTIDYPDADESGVDIRNPLCGYEARVVALETTPARKRGVPDHQVASSPPEGVNR